MLTFSDFATVTVDLLAGGAVGATLALFNPFEIHREAMAEERRLDRIRMDELQAIQELEDFTGLPITKLIEPRQ